MIDHTRDWLIKNKIFFEVGLFLIISFVGVVLSYNSNRIAEQNLQLVKQASQPFIRIDLEQKINASSQRYEDISLLVFNDGEKLKSYNSKFDVFIRVTASCARCLDPKVIQIKLNDYFKVSSQTHEFQGKIEWLWFEKSELSFHNLYMSAVSEHYLSSYHIELIILGHLHYLNINGESKEQYFQIDPVNAGVEISKEKYADIFNQSTETNMSFSIDSLKW